MTPEQLATLKTHIQSQPDLAAFYDAGNLSGLADALNAPANPVFVGWRRGIPSDEMGSTVNYSALAAMTSANTTRVQLFMQLNPVSIDGSVHLDAYFVDTFGGALNGEGANTRAALAAMLRRNASRLEKVFATGTGSTASPATLVVEGPISYLDLIGL